MLFQDTASVVYLKYKIDSSALKQAKKTQTKKSDAGLQSLPAAGDTSARLKNYSPQQQADSPGSGLPYLREFRFSDIDTIRSQSFDQPVPSGPRLFSGHKLEPQHRSPQSYNKPNPDWFTIILFIVVFGFMWIRVFYLKILRQIINAFFSTSVTNQIVRDENILIQRASVMLSVLFYMVAALFLYQVSITFEWQSNWLTDGFSRLIIFAFFIAFAYSVKMIVLKLMGYLLDIDRQVATYIFNIFLMNNVLGMFLLPVVMVIAYVYTPYSQTLLITALLVIGTTFLYRLVRGVFIGMSIPRFSIFYLILYLCAFEIAPLALIFKIASG